MVICQNARIRFDLPIATAIAIAGAALCSASPLVAQETSITTDIVTADGESAGTVTFVQQRHGVVVEAKLENLPQGEHGFHIHETGMCKPDFKAAGGHYNPIDAKHGFDGEGGYHVGDLPNISVEADGTATAQFFVPQITLREKSATRYPFTLRDKDGSAVIIHAQPDDYRDMSSAGDRLACGVIVAPTD